MFPHPVPDSEGAQLVIWKADLVWGEEGALCVLNHAILSRGRKCPLPGDLGTALRQRPHCSSVAPEACDREEGQAWAPASLALTAQTGVTLGQWAPDIKKNQWWVPKDQRRMANSSPGSPSH